MKKLITLFIMVLVMNSFSQNYNVELIKESFFGNEYNDVKVVDSLAYLATEGKLFIYNVTNRAKPQLLKYFSYDFNLQKIEIKDNFAFVGAGAAGVKIFDISNRLNPTLISSLPTLDSVTSLKISNNLLLTAEFTDGFKIYNIQNPANPVLLKNILQQSLVLSVTVKEPNYAYVTIPDQFVAIVNFSVPTLADTVGKIPLLAGSLYFDTAIKDTFIYVADYIGGLHIFSIGNPTKPQYLNTIPEPTTGVLVQIYNNNLYITKKVFAKSRIKALNTKLLLSGQGVNIYDITNRVNPPLKAVINVESPNSCYQFENYLYLSSSLSFKTYNVSAPTPVLVDSIESVGSVNYTLVDGDYLYVGTSRSGLLKLNIANPANPVYITRYTGAGGINGMTKMGNYLFLASEKSVYVVDISNPNTINFVASYNYNGFNYAPARIAMPNDSIAYVVGGNLPGFSALKTKPINNIWETDRYGYGILPYSIFSDVVCKDTLIYTVNNHNAFYILSITPTGLLKPWYIIGEGGFAGIHLNNKIYIAAGTTGLKTLDVTNPLLPILLSTFPTNGDARNIIVKDNVAYVSNGTAGIDIINVSNPAAPYRVGRYKTSGNASHISLKDSYIYLADKSSFGVYRFTLNLPSSIHLIFPNGGETLYSGTVQNIEWTTTNVNAVKIEFSSNNGATWTQIASNIPSTTTTYAWTVPNISSTQCKIRISDNVNPALFDESNSTFTIISPPSITLTSPNGGEVWQSGTSKTITWNSSNINTVKIEYTTNNGSNWILVAQNVVSSNSYLWIVPNTPSTQCRVRVSDFNNPQISDVSDSLFTIFKLDVSWLSTIKIKDNGTSSDSLIFGQAPNATNGIDPQLGEYELPPAPPSGVFDVRFNLPVSPIVSSKKDFRNDNESLINWVMQFQPSSAGYPITFRWDPSSLPAGNFFLKDLVTGTLVNVNMKTDSVYTLTLTALNQLRIEYTNQACKTITVNTGWNLLSVPLLANNMLINSLFPTRTSSAFDYNNGYQQIDTAKNGKGFWIKFDSLHNINICGSAVTSNTIPVKSGWNLVGPFDKNVPVSAITTNPPSIIGSFFFGFSNGYTNADTLRAGRGYWVKMNQDGNLIIPLQLAKPTIATKQQSIIKSEWTKITITDAQNITNTLYLTDEEMNFEKFELPPLPPVGIGDIRFISNKNVERLNYQNTILLSSLVYPIRITVEGNDLKFTDNINGSLVNTIVKKGSTITLNNPGLNSILVSKLEIPTQFSLFQNYPNPFNPTTVIKFGLAEKSKTSIKIYNQLGQLVTELINSELDAGYHQVTFDAKNLSSGIYFYQINAGDFKDIKKMILIK